MPHRKVSPESLGRQLEGRQVARASTDGRQRLTIQFSDGFSLLIEATPGGLVAMVEQPVARLPEGADRQPTKRQFEYLGFIARYMARFGRAPAESDIARHFFVSPPSVNQMMQTLERLGFIARQPGMSRSIRICIELPHL